MEDLKWTQAELNELTARAHEAGFQIWHHTLTPAGIKASADAFAYALARCPRLDHRHRIEHCADRWHRLKEDGTPFVPDELKAQIKALGVIPTPTPQFIYAWPDRPGVPMRAVINDGDIITGSSDSTASQPESSNPWHGIWCLAARENLRGSVVTPEERLTPLEAIRVFTLWGAYGGFEEKIKGSLEPGKLADFCILDRDPLSVEPGELREIAPDVTAVGNRVAYASGKFQLTDTFS